MTVTEGTLTPYHELADVLANMRLVVRESRRARGVGVRAAAAQMGVSPSALYRMEAGDDLSLPNAIAVLRWLDQTSPDGSGVAS